ncbi:MAG: tetratricopeptide repeat protein [Candidatus Aminicenantes bacterium]|nr:tetratricopeptide repeat protein [Candidatus Aminicenantes bacterium]
MNPIQKNRLLNLCIFILFFISIAVLAVLAQEHMGKGRISGTVVDEKGQPLEGVLIVAESLEYETKLQGYSDKKGRFAVAGMGTGNWRITATKKGYTSSYINKYVRQLRKSPPITFKLKKLTEFAPRMSDEESFELFDKGNLLLKEEKYDEALVVFEEFVLKYPEIYHTHLNIGTCYLKKGELDKAEAEFKLILDKTIENFGGYKKDPQASLRAFTGLGEIYIRKEDFETAQKYFAQGLDISPEDEVAAYNVAEVLFSHQEVDEAIKYFELSIKIKKDWSKPYMKLGYVYLNKGDFNKSLEYFNKFIEMDPENPEVPSVKNIVATLEKMKKEKRGGEEG